MVKPTTHRSPSNDRIRWSVPRLLRRSAEVLRWEGIRGLAYKALGKTIYRHVVLLELDLERFDADPRARTPIEVRRLGEQDLAPYLALLANEREDEIRQRWTAGHIGFAAWQEERLVSASWFSPRDGWIPEIQHRLELKRGQIYGYGSYTAPDFRGKNIAPARTAGAYRRLRADGYESVVVFVLPENRSNFRVTSKLGFRRVGVAGVVRLGLFCVRFIRAYGGSTRWRIER
jgi:GNAT superfamily N-acetyltransferase